VNDVRVSKQLDIVQVMFFDITVKRIVIEVPYVQSFTKTIPEGKGREGGGGYGQFHERHYCWLGDNATRTRIQCPW
jgi:hypothetical protein